MVSTRFAPGYSLKKVLPNQRYLDIMTCFWFLSPKLVFTTTWLICNFLIKVEWWNFVPLLLRWFGFYVFAQFLFTYCMWIISMWLRFVFKHYNETFFTKLFYKVVCNKFSWSIFNGLFSSIIMNHVSEIRKYNAWLITSNCCLL